MFIRSKTQKKKKNEKSQIIIRNDSYLICVFRKIKFVPEIKKDEKEETLEIRCIRREKKRKLQIILE